MATPHRSCSTCGRERPVQLQMTVRAGPVITLLSCSACEDRIWLIDGEPGSVAEVLAAIAGDDGFVLGPTHRVPRARAHRPAALRLL